MTLPNCVQRTKEANDGWFPVGISLALVAKKTQGITSESKHVLSTKEPGVEKEGSKAKPILVGLKQNGGTEELDDLSIRFNWKHL